MQSQFTELAKHVEKWGAFAGRFDEFLEMIGLALVPESSVRDELRRGVLVELDVPAMRTAIPVVAVHRRNGYLSPAATALLELLTGGALRPKARHKSGTS